MFALIDAPSISICHLSKERTHFSAVILPSVQGTKLLFCALWKTTAKTVHYNNTTTKQNKHQRMFHRMLERKQQQQNIETLTEKNTARTTTEHQQ